MDSLEKHLEKNPPRDREVVASPADKGKPEQSVDEEKVNHFILWMMDNAYSDPLTLEEIEDGYGRKADEVFLNSLVEKGILDFDENEKTYTLIPDSKYVVEKVM